MLQAVKPSLGSAESARHRVWQAKFNPKHDQLLLTASSDGLVNLHQLNGLGKQQVSPCIYPLKYSISTGKADCAGHTQQGGVACHMTMHAGVQHVVELRRPQNLTCKLFAC